MTSPNAEERRRGRGEDGYNLVVLMVLVTVMNIAVAAVLPSWSTMLKREREAETIFRGLQYAEAIRVFQNRHGRLPNTLDELIEVEPRSLRQLYKNPMTEDGAWGLLIQSGAPGAGAAANRGNVGGRRQELSPPDARGGAATGQGPGINPALTGRPQGGQPQGGQPQGGQQQRYVAVPPAQETDVFGRRAERRTTGPIVGVYPAVDETSLRTFFGEDNYSGWHFTVSLIPLPVALGERPLPRVHAGWIGKPFREDLKPPGGAGPQSGSAPRQGTNLVPGPGRDRGRR